MFWTSNLQSLESFDNGIPFGAGLPKGNATNFLVSEVKLIENDVQRTGK